MEHKYIENLPRTITTAKMLGSACGTCKPYPRYMPSLSVCQMTPFTGVTRCWKWSNFSSSQNKRALKLRFPLTLNGLCSETKISDVKSVQLWYFSCQSYHSSPLLISHLSHPVNTSPSLHYVHSPVRHLNCLYFQSTKLFGILFR